MNSYNAVIFDMDGVIFDSERAMLGCWEELSKKYYIDNIKIPYNLCIGSTFARTKEIMLNAYGDDFPYDQFSKEVYEIYQSKYSDGRLPIKTGVFELLNYLKKNNKKIALASSTYYNVVSKLLKEAHLFDYFDEIVTGDMIRNSKPDPEIFLLACSKLHEIPENCFAIEDSYSGINSAYNGNLRPIMIPDLLSPNDEMIVKTEVIFSTLLEVIPFLDA